MVSNPVPLHIMPFLFLLLIMDAIFKEVEEIAGGNINLHKDLTLSGLQSFQRQSILGKILSQNMFHVLPRKQHILCGYWLIHC